MTQTMQSIHSHGLSPEQVRKFVSMVMAHEGDFDAVNRNTDGAGVSIGIFQWPQRTGGLSVVLDAYYQAEPLLFQRIFGPYWAALLDAARRRSMEPVGGAYLWHEPWVSRFIQAGRQPLYQQVQLTLAEQSPFIASAVKSSRLLGMPSERVMAVTLDAAVSQGPEFATKIARRVAQKYAGRFVPVRELLRDYLHTSVAHMRRLTAPERPPSSAHLSWRPVGDEWHLYAGSINLYRNIMKRRGAFIDDDSLADVALLSSSLFPV